MKRMLMLAALTLVLAACHGTVQDSAMDPWYVDANYCGLDQSGIRLWTTDPSPSYISGISQRRTTPNNCAAFAGGAAGHVRASLSLWKTGLGQCWAGDGSHLSADGEYYVGVTSGVGARLCGDGYYHGRTDATIWNGGAYVSDSNGINSPDDYTCYHNPCQG